VKRRRLAVVILTVGSVLVSTFGYLRQASAVVDPPICTAAYEALDGRCMNQSYFSGIDFDRNTMQNVFGSPTNPPLGSGNYYTYVDSLGSDGINQWDFPPNVDNGVPNAAQNFINFIHAYLFNQTYAYSTAVAGCSFPNSLTPPSPGYTVATSTTCDKFRIRMIGAAYLVLTMMGGKYTQYSVGSVFNNGPYSNAVQNGVYDAQQEFNTWSQEILQTDAAGNINWNQIASAPNGHPNTGASDYDHDVQMFQQTAEVRHAIVFNNPTGQYIINRRCANSFGSVAPLAPLADMNMQTSLGGLYDSTGKPVTGLVPGANYTIHPEVFNTGGAASNIVYLELKTPANTTNVSIDAAKAPNGTGSGWSGVNNCQPNYPAANVSGSPPGTCAGAHWWWRYNNIPASSPFIDQAATFQVSAAAPLGSTICFQSDVAHQTIANPTDPNNYTVSTVNCYQVASPRYPSVVGGGSDIHAGGGICDGPQNYGIIDTNPNAGSLGEYVVSASGTIGSMGSNNSAGDTSLRLGDTGSYSTACRPDLYGYAINHLPAGAAWTSVPVGSSYNLASPLPGEVTVNLPYGVVQHVAYISGDIGIYGQLNRALTVITSGQVSIDNDITRTGGSNRTNATGLGIIANGNVNFQCGCGSNRNVDAMIFSDSAIDTCYSGSFPSPPHCDNSLTVHGMLMANELLLHRLGAIDQPGAQAGEIVVMDPTLYINTPYFFDSGADDVGQMSGQGTRPPLY
jgi:hypothetical protein